MLVKMHMLARKALLTTRRNKHRHAAVGPRGIDPGGLGRRRCTARTGRRGSTRLVPVGLGPHSDVGRSRHRNDLPADVRTSWGVIRVATGNLRDKGQHAAMRADASGAETLEVGRAYLKQ
jgi:hypothetical protein